MGLVTLAIMVRSEVSSFFLFTENHVRTIQPFETNEGGSSFNKKIAVGIYLLHITINTVFLLFLQALIKR